MPYLAIIASNVDIAEITKVVDLIVTEINDFVMRLKFVKLCRHRISYQSIWFLAMPQTMIHLYIEQEKEEEDREMEGRQQTIRTLSTDLDNSLKHKVKLKRN